MTDTVSATVAHKFGGSSLADASCFRLVADIIAARPESQRIVVVSAMSGVTDALVGVTRLAASGSDAYDEDLDSIRVRHLETLGELVGADGAPAVAAAIERDLADVADVLRAAALLRGYSRDTLDLVTGYGEVWSAQMLAALIRATGDDVAWLDAREVLIVERTDAGADVDWAASRELMTDWIARAGGLPRTLVVTGFVASTAAGVAATLGRNGSDYSASIFAALLEADEIHIWTDVDGVMSANPRLVGEAVTLDSLSYDEAMELAYFGAKVIHPRTMTPALERDLPIFIRNTFRPEHPGTRIHALSSSAQPVKGLATVESIALLNLEGTGMIGVPGTAHRLFGALRDESISVILISQGSSEHSICFAIPEAQATRAEDVVRRAFDSELRQSQIQRVEVSRGSSILAVVGDGMAGSHGVAAQVFSTLGKAGVNIRAIAQGASERNISAVIDGRDTARAVRAVHAGFYLSPHTVSIGFIGPGTVGSVLIDQLAGESERLRRDFNLDLRVRGIIASKRMYLASGAIDLKEWRARLAQATEPTDLARFVNHLHAAWLPHTVIIDCTASAEIAAHYREWLLAGIHIVTPNKKANSAALSAYRAVLEARRATGAHYLYEATVGAGLPIITTLRDLRETGDRIRSVEGLLSGTLAYLFNVYDGKEPFSSIVRAAKAKGYTEPDPRDDLSGTDVARKLIILGREMGLPLEMQDVKVESLVPAELVNCSIDEYLERLPQYDAAMLKRYEAARAKGKLLRYVGRVDAHGNASVGLVELDTRHSFANSALTDNVVRFETDRYCDNPLIVQGPGAGPEVTAAGVFADLLRVCAYLGAKL